MLLLLLLLLRLLLLLPATYSGADAYLQFGSKRYFKDPATYQQQLAQFQSDRRFFLGWEPAWFWDQVEPLAGLSLACSGG